MKSYHLYIFTESLNDHRLSRLLQEAKKYDLPTTPIKSDLCTITNTSISYEGQSLIFDDHTICWFLGNPLLQHMIIRIIDLSEAFVWPNANAIMYSDKFYANHFFSSIGVPTPRTVLINNISMTSEIPKIVGSTPYVLKKNNGSKGAFVELIHTEKEAKEFLETNVRKTHDGMVIRYASFSAQEYLKEAGAADYRVLCIQDSIIGIIKREAASGFKANISLGGSATHILHDPLLEEHALKIMQKSGLYYAGIDFIKDNGTYYAIEINTSAQFKGFEYATKINVAQRIMHSLINTMETR